MTQCDSCGLLILLWESGRSISGKHPRHLSTPAIIFMIRVDQVKYHQGKASPPVGSGCQGSFQIPEGKAGILLAEQGFVLFTESVSR